MPQAPHWTVVFLPQLLFAVRPEKLIAAGRHPTAVLLSGRIAARSREAALQGVKRFMSAEEALLCAPLLQLERVDQTAEQEVSKVLLAIAQSAGPAMLLQASNSGAAAVLLETDVESAEEAGGRLLQQLLPLGFDAFAGAGDAPLEALAAAVESARAAGADYDARALLSKLARSCETLELTAAPSHFLLRVDLEQFEKQLPLARLTAALEAWVRALGAVGADWKIRVFDRTGRAARLERPSEGAFSRSADEVERAAESARLRRMLIEAAVEGAAASLELEAAPVRTPREAPNASPLVKRLSGIVGSARVYQLERTGDPRPEAAQRHAPAVDLLGKAHQRDPMPVFPASESAASEHLPIEIFERPRALPSTTERPTLNGEIELLDGPRPMVLSDDERRDYYVGRSSAGERLWLFRDASSGRWYLQGRFA